MDIAKPTHPQRLLLQQSCLLLLLSLLLELVVAHGHDSEDEVDQVERSEENDQEKENNMPRAGSPEDSLVEILPVVLGHQTKGTKESPAEGVEVGVVVVGVLSEALDAGVVCWAGTGPAGVATKLIVLGLFFLVPVGSVGVESKPSLVIQFSPGAVLREGLDTLVSEDAHVDLEAEEGKDREGEHSEDDHIAKILHGLDHSTDNRLQS